MSVLWPGQDSQIKPKIKPSCWDGQKELQLQHLQQLGLLKIGPIGLRQGATRTLILFLRQLLLLRVLLQLLVEINVLQDIF